MVKPTLSTDYFREMEPQLLALAMQTLPRFEIRRTNPIRYVTDKSEREWVVPLYVARNMEGELWEFGDLIDLHVWSHALNAEQIYLARNFQDLSARLVDAYESGADDRADVPWQEEQLSNWFQFGDGYDLFRDGQTCLVRIGPWTLTTTLEVKSFNVDDEDREESIAVADPAEELQIQRDKDFHACRVGVRIERSGETVATSLANEYQPCNVIGHEENGGVRIRAAAAKAALAAMLDAARYRRWVVWTFGDELFGWTAERDSTGLEQGSTVSDSRRGRLDLSDCAVEIEGWQSTIIACVHDSRSTNPEVEFGRYSTLTPTQIREAQSVPDYVAVTLAVDVYRMGRLVGARLASASFSLPPSDLGRDERFKAGHIHLTTQEAARFAGSLFADATAEARKIQDHALAAFKDLDRNLLPQDSITLR